MKIGVMFGSPETTTGGNALKFYASVRMDIRRIGAIKKGDRIVGNRNSRQGRPEQGFAAPFKGPCSTSCTARASRAGEIIPTWASNTASSKSPAPGTAIRAIVSVRVKTTRAVPAREPRARQKSNKIREKIGITIGGAVSKMKVRPTMNNAGAPVTPHHRRGGYAKKRRRAIRHIVLRCGA